MLSFPLVYSTEVCWLHLPIVLAFLRSKPQWTDDSPQHLESFTLNTARFYPSPAPMAGISSRPHDGNVAHMSFIPSKPHPTIWKPEQHSRVCACQTKLCQILSHHHTPCMCREINVCAAMWAVMAIPSGTCKVKKDWHWIHRLTQLRNCFVGNIIVFSSLLCRDIQIGCMLPQVYFLTVIVLFWLN